MERVPGYRAKAVGWRGVEPYSLFNGPAEAPNVGRNWQKGKKNKRAPARVARLLSTLLGVSPCTSSLDSERMSDPVERLGYAAAGPPD